MPNWFKEKIRVLILLDGSDEYYHLLNIIEIRKHGALYEYKISIDIDDLTFFRGIIVDRITGKTLRKGSQESGFINGIEIGYHQNGNVSYKNKTTQLNLSPRHRFNPLNNLTSPQRFFSMSAVNPRLFKKISPKHSDVILNFGKSEESMVFNIDFYFSPLEKKYNLSPSPWNKRMFKNHQQFCFQDDLNKVALDFSVYEYTGKKTNLFFQIPGEKWNTKSEKIKYIWTSGKILNHILDFLFTSSVVFFRNLKHNKYIKKLKLFKSL